MKNKKTFCNFPFRITQQKSHCKKFNYFINFIMEQTIQDRLILSAKDGLIDLPTLQLFFRSE